MGVKQGERLHISDLIRLASRCDGFISHRRSVGGLFRGDEWVGAHGNAQILPVWETDFCCSVSTDGAHRELPVRDRWVCSSPDQPDHHQSPEHPSRTAPHLLQLLSDEAGVQTQGAVANTDSMWNLCPNCRHENSLCYLFFSVIWTRCKTKSFIAPKYKNTLQRHAVAVEGRADCGVTLQHDLFCVFLVNTAIRQIWLAFSSLCKLKMFHKHIHLYSFALLSFFFF